MAGHVTQSSRYAGTWYPGDADKLSSSVRECFEASARRTGPWLAPGALAFVVPHAGMTYSGVVAAAAYRHIAAQRPKRVIVLGFSHAGVPPGIVVPDVNEFETPLGYVQVDRDAVEQIPAGGAVRLVSAGSVSDHSLEIQIPYLKHAVPDARIVPVYVNRPDEATRSAAAEILSRLLDGSTVILASSDLTHFGRDFGFKPFAVDEESHGKLAALDGKVIDAIGSLDPGLFRATIRETGSTTCGLDPILLLLNTLQRVDADVFQQKLDYQTSGELTGDFHHSVSYGALGYFPHSSFELDVDGQRLLLQSVEESLRIWQAQEQRRPVLPQGEHPMLASHLGAFVTIYVNGELRGCIGDISGREALSRLVPELALSAALDDARFEPLSSREPRPEVEISILTPLKRIPDRSAFRLSEHGVLLKNGFHRGLLLPKVASELGWNAEKFFEALARKADLSPKVYNEPETELYVFRAQQVR